MCINVISEINLLFKNFSLSKIWTFSQSKLCKNSIRYSVITEWVSMFQFICLRCSDILLESFLHVCLTDASHVVYNKFYRPRFYYQILGERSFVLLWNYLICYRWKRYFYVSVFINRQKFLWRRINIWQQKPRYTIIISIVICGLLLRNFLLYQYFRRLLIVSKINSADSHYLIIYK